VCVCVCACVCVCVCTCTRTEDAIADGHKKVRGKCSCMFVCMCVSVHVCVCVCACTRTEDSLQTQNWNSCQKTNVVVSQAISSPLILFEDLSICKR